HHAAVERPRAVQRHQRDDVADVVRPQSLQQLADAVGLELEDALGVPLLEQIVRLPSSSGSLYRSMVMPRGFLISFSAFSRSVSVRRPRKSIFSRPTCSRSPITHCVATTASAWRLSDSFFDRARCKGT